MSTVTIAPAGNGIVNTQGTKNVGASAIEINVYLFAVKDTKNKGNPPVASMA
jgi:hypothetical protein